MTARRTIGARALALVAVTALGFAACSSSKKTSTSSPPTTSGGGGSSTTSGGGSGGSGGATSVKLGFFGALTGANAQLGINIEDGEKLAISQYNANSPAVKVTLDAFDSQGDASQASNGAQKLISDKDVAVIGPAFSGESEVADPIFEQAGVPNVSASATRVDLATKGRKYFHRVVADDSAQGPADADYLVKTKGATTVAVIDDSSSYGEGLGSSVRDTLKTNGGKDVLDDHIDPKGSDYGATVNKVMAAKPGAVFFGGYYDAAGRLVNQLRAAGYKGLFMSGDGSEDARFISDAGGAPAEGAFLSCACADTTNNPKAQSFNAAYRAAFGSAPAIYSAEAFDATNAVLAGIKAGDTTGPTLNTYLASVNYPGITKTVKFQTDGNIYGSTIYIYEVQSGKIVQIGTSS